MSNAAVNGTNGVDHSALEEVLAKKPFDFWTTFDEALGDLDFVKRHLEAVVFTLDTARALAGVERAKAVGIAHFLALELEHHASNAEVVLEGIHKACCVEEGDDD